MLTISTEEFLSDASKYLSEAERGETIIVKRGERDVVIRIEQEPKADKTLGGAVPVDDYSWAIVDGKRPIGLARGEFSVPDDFDAPLPDDILDAFEGQGES
jgi:hypothetical protein